MRLWINALGLGMKACFVGIRVDGLARKCGMGFDGDMSGTVSSIRAECTRLHILTPCSSQNVSPVRIQHLKNSMRIQFNNLIKSPVVSHCISIMKLETKARRMLPHTKSFRFAPKIDLRIQTGKCSPRCANHWVMCDVHAAWCTSSC